MKYALLSCFVMLVAACGDLQPEPPDSKLNSSTGNNTSNSTTTNGANSTTNNTTSNNSSDDLMAEFGTEGPADRNPKSQGGNAICDLEDVRTDDIGDVNSAEVPQSPWTEVVGDDPGRCGDDRETLAWRLMNCERIGQGLTPYQCDLRMVWMGREHTVDMIVRDFWDHDNPDGETPYDRMQRHGIDWRAAAENLANGDGVLNSHYQWMDSREHRENILGNYTHTGVGSEDGGVGLLSTAVFISP